MATKKTTTKRKPALTQRELDLTSELATAKASNNSGRVSEINRELRRLRFVRMAPKRVKKALRAIYQVGKLGNRSSYQYTDEEVAKVLSALGEAVTDVEAAFAATKDRITEDFSL